MLLSISFYVKATCKVTLPLDKISDFIHKETQSYLNLITFDVLKHLLYAFEYPCMRLKPVLAIKSLLPNHKVYSIVFNWYF